MSSCIFSLAGHSAALEHAGAALRNAGIPVLDQPDVTATHLLLPVPSFQDDGTIRGGGELEAVLSRLSQQVVIIGGHLRHPALEGYRCADLLRDPQYVTQNAAITAHCAIALAMSKLPVTLSGCPVLVIGWGRIGKCLTRLLRRLDAQVTVAARKETDRALITALGYRAVDTAGVDALPYRLIFNTVPVMLLPQCPGSAVKIDLASQPGIGGPDVIWARGLPGKDAPESSGALISRTAIMIAKEGQG